MPVFLLYIVFLIALHLLLDTVSKRNHSKIEILFCSIAYLGLIVLAAFRGPSVGADTMDYISDYNDIKGYSWSKLFDVYTRYEFFYSICKLFTLINLPIAAWFAFIEIIYVSAIARLIHSDSKDRIYSIILFITIGLFLFSLAGLKQTMAMGLILHSFMELRSKRFVPAILLAISAFFSHTSVVAFIPAVILYYLKDLKRYNTIIAVLIIVVLISSRYFVSTLLEIKRFAHFDMYLGIDKSYTIWTLLFYILLILPCLPFLKKYRQNPLYPNKPRYELSCILMACALQYMASLSPSLFRLALYYTPFYLVFIPSIFNDRKSLTMRLVKIVILLGVIFFFAYTNLGFVYSFA